MLERRDDVGEVRGVDGHVGVERDHVAPARRAIPRRTAAPLPRLRGCWMNERLGQVAVDVVGDSEGVVARAVVHHDELGGRQVEVVEPATAASRSRPRGERLRYRRG